MRESDFSVFSVLKGLSTLLGYDLRLIDGRQTTPGRFTVHYRTRGQLKVGPTSITRRGICMGTKPDYKIRVISCEGFFGGGKKSGPVTQATFAAFFSSNTLRECVRVTGPQVPLYQSILPYCMVGALLYLADLKVSGNLGTKCPGKRCEMAPRFQATFESDKY